MQKDRTFFFLRPADKEATGLWRRWRLDGLGARVDGAGWGRGDGGGLV
jgi:hypothetical protein